MPVKIMPNAKCPCGSGKKYKYCCARRADFVNGLYEATGGQYLDLHYVLDEVLTRSEQMRSFLGAILPRIPAQIVFAHCPQQQERMRSLSTADRSTAIVLLREVPVRPEDEFDLAHEFGHIYYGCQNYPAARTMSPDLMPSGLALTNAVLEPMIDRLQKGYGFSLEEHLRRCAGEELAGLSDLLPERQLNPMERHFGRCLVIRALQERELAEDASIFEEVLALCREKYPELLRFARGYVEKIIRQGTGTPQSVRALLEELVRENEVDLYISVV